MLHRVWQRDEGHMAYGRVFANEHDEITAIYVWHRVQSSSSEHRFAAGKFIRAILGAGAEVVRDLQLAYEIAKGGPEQAVEGAGVAGIACQRLVAMLVFDLPQALGDLGKCLLPADAIEVTLRIALERKA